MVDHFHEQVIALNKIGGQARAMVVCSGIERAIQYFHAFRTYLSERKSPYQAIVAFSGEPEYEGVKVTESSMNGFPGSEIADKIQEDPYRFLICADKFQTGNDEPLLHTMYVDKALSGIKAVQTLSRLNRAHPQKHDVFVLDFMNNTETITAAFADYYRTTILGEETDPNKLHDLKTALSNILKSFNDQFATLFTDADRIVKRIQEDIAPKVAADEPYKNAKLNTPNAARIELDAALMRVMGPLLKDDTEFYKQFVQNDSFRRFVTNMVHDLTQA